jgi:hypothetical protein
VLVEGYTKPRTGSNMGVSRGLMLRRSISFGFHPEKLLFHGIIVIKSGIIVIKILQ